VPLYRWNLLWICTSYALPPACAIVDWRYPASLTWAFRQPGEQRGSLWISHCTFHAHGSVSENGLLLRRRGAPRFTLPDGVCASTRRLRLPHTAHRLHSQPMRASYRHYVRRLTPTGTQYPIAPHTHPHPAAFADGKPRHLGKTTFSRHLRTSFLATNIRLLSFLPAALRWHGGRVARGALARLDRSMSYALAYKLTSAPFFTARLYQTGVPS